MAESFWPGCSIEAAWRGAQTSPRRLKRREAMSGKRFRPYRLERHRFNRHRAARVESEINKRLPGTAPDFVTTDGILKRASQWVNHAMGCSREPPASNISRCVGI